MWFSRFWNPRNRVETADQADRWTFSRLFSFGGDVSGAANVNGAGDVTFTLAVLDDSHNHKTLTYQQLPGNDFNQITESGHYLGGAVVEAEFLNGPNTGVAFHRCLCHAIVAGAYRSLIFHSRLTGEIWSQATNGAVTTAGWKRLDNAGAVSGSIQTNTAADKGWRKCEVTGIIEQWGWITVAASTTNQSFNYPIPFPNGLAGVFINAEDLAGNCWVRRGGTTAADWGSKNVFKVDNNTAYSRLMFWHARGH